MQEMFNPYPAHVENMVILLTWRIWWAPNNASKWQVGFNSAFKGLIIQISIMVVSSLCLSHMSNVAYTLFDPKHGGQIKNYFY